MSVGPPPGLLHPDYLAALQTMPRDRNGHVMDLHYVPPGAERDRLEDAWREWCRTHERKVWPVWIEKWADTKRRGKAR